MSPQQHAEQIDKAFRKLCKAVKQAHDELPVGPVRVTVAGMLDLIDDFGRDLDSLREATRR